MSEEKINKIVEKEFKISSEQNEKYFLQVSVFVNSEQKTFIE